MSQSGKNPTFNMKVVVQETGLKPETVRAWERRYGVPNPERTSGGHRLFSRQEIEMLKWLVARQEEGVSISRAIDLWQQLEKNGQNPLQQGETAVVKPEIEIIQTKGRRVDELRRDWLEASLAYNEQKAKLILARAFALLPLETVCFDIFTQGLHEVGEGWYEGRVSVQQEHFISELVMRQLEALLSALPLPIRSERIIVACCPTEQHTFSALLISILLRRKGYDVIYLGANVPLEQMEASVVHIKPSLVIMCAQTLTAAGHLLSMAQKLKELNVLFAFGGGVFNQIEQALAAIPGHYLGNSLEQVPQAVEKLLKSAPALSEPQAPSIDYEKAYDYFVKRRTAVEAHLHASQGLSHMPTPMLNNINQEFGNNIEAALRLGDIAMVEANLLWVKGLLLNNHVLLPEKVLSNYLQQYADAVKSVGGEPLDILLDWLSKQ